MNVAEQAAGKKKSMSKTELSIGVCYARFGTFTKN